MCEKGLVTGYDTVYSAQIVTTIRDVASLAGVSIATVSRVMNGEAPVSDDLARRVLAAVDRLDYRPSAVARSLKTAETEMIGMVIPDIMNPFFPELIRGVEDGARAEGYVTLLGTSGGDSERERDYLAHLGRWRVGGVIYVPGRHSPPDASLLAYLARQSRLVNMDRRLDGFDGDVVMVDNVRGASIAGRHLIELGHRRIAVINLALDSSVGAERATGYRTVLHDAGVYDESIVRYDAYTLESGRAHAMELFAHEPRPTAILAGTDLIAFGVLQAAAAEGLRVPDDLSVVGFDGISLIEVVVPRLTTVAQPTYQMGRLAATLIARPDGAPEHGDREHLFEPWLDMGASTRTAR